VNANITINMKDKQRNLKPDIVIRVRFLTADECGRQTAIVIPKDLDHHYGCPLFVDGEGFACRLLVTGRTIELGATYELPVKFLWPHNALPKLSLGKAVTLWEGKDIATGTVIKVM
jgi:hypothetical protein